MNDDVAVPRAALLAVRRLLWDVGATDTTSHDQRVEALHWAAVFDHAAGMPPWPTPGEPHDKVSAFYERIRDHLDAVIRSLDSGGPA